MAITRSPRYPNIPLQDAISKAKSIYSREHMSAMTPQVAAEAMGYQGINGSSLKTISSLKKYGLLDGRGEDVRLTSDAQILIIDDPTSSDYKVAASRCAFAPEVFSEIKQQFPSLASERNIAVYLEKQGFKPDAAATVAKNYKESLGLVSGEGIPANEGNELSANFSRAGGAGAPKSTVPLEVQRVEVASTLSGDAPYRIVQDGKKLHIIASVDLQGLRKLKKIIENYENLLEILEGGNSAAN